VADWKLLKSTTIEVDHEFWKEKLAGDSECEELYKISSTTPGALVMGVVACFPGSGSKWMMEMLEFATGYDANV